MSDLPLCVLFDDNYLYPFVIAMYSASLNSTDSYELVVGDTGWNLSDDSKDLIEQTCKALHIRLRWVHIPLNQDFKRSFAHVPPLAAGRLFFLDLMDNAFVYSDVDSIFLNGWQEVLAKPNFGTDSIAGVVRHGDIDWINKVNEDRQKQGTVINQAMFENSKNYFGSGLLVVDPVRWREKGLDRKWKEIYFNQFEELGLWILEQDILNYILKGATYTIPLEYNFPAQWKGHTRNFKTFRPVEASPIKIVQFQGNAKPWNYSDQSRLKLFLKTQDFLSKQQGTVQHSTYFWLLEFWWYENLFWEWAFEQESKFLDAIRKVYLKVEKKDF